MYKLKTSNQDILQNIPDIVEGLENRIITSLYSFNDINDILETIKTKRYTLSRIKRIMISILLDLNKIELNQFKQNGYAEYVKEKINE